MRYVIWGAGKRGITALSILGNERVLAFVDVDKNLQGNAIDGIKIYSPEYIETLEEKYVILVTPIEYELQIEKTLQNLGISNYLLFSQYPYSFDLESPINIELLRCTFDSYGKRFLFRGITWFNLYLYELLEECGKEVQIFVDSSQDVELIKAIESDYCIADNEEAFTWADLVLNGEFDKCTLGEHTKEKRLDNREMWLDILWEKMYPVTDSRIADFENVHQGQRCFIIATGPSLKVDDLNAIMKNGDICISMNRIYNIFDRTQWRPHYYVIEDRKMIEDLADDIAKLDLDYKFVNSDVPQYWELENSRTSFALKMLMQDCNSDKLGFSFNPERFVYNGYTVTYVCLQLAIYMGFSNIYLVGVDFNYSEDIYAEENHFEGYQRYYKDIRLNEIKPEKMKRAYQNARRVAEQMGIHIYNATRGGKLEVFERVDLDCLLREVRE